MTTKIMQDGEADSIPCPADRCPILVDDDMVLRMITGSGRAVQVPAPDGEQLRESE